MSHLVFDRSVLDQWKEADPEGWGSIVRELFEVYRRVMPELMGALGSAATTGDLAGTSRAAHSLKAAYGNMGAMAASHTCSLMESAANESRAVQVRELSQRLEAERTAADAELLKYVAELPPDPTELEISPPDANAVASRAA